MKLHIPEKGHRPTEMFAALGDPTRARIVELLSMGKSLRLSDLVQEFDSTRQTVTRHLEVLAAAGITMTERKGRERYTSLSEDAFDPIREWLSRYDRFWDERLDELKALIEGGEQQ